MVKILGSSFGTGQTMNEHLDPALRFYSQIHTPLNIEGELDSFVLTSPRTNKIAALTKGKKFPNGK